MRKHYTESQRAALLDLVAKGRTPLRAAAAQLGVAESTAYYWLNQAGRHRSPVAHVARGSSQRGAVTAPRFAQLVRAGDTAATITVCIGAAVIEVRAGSTRRVAARCGRGARGVGVVIARGLRI